MKPKETAINVLVIPSWYPPGGGAFFREHSIALAQSGLQVSVLAAIETGLRDDPGRFLRAGKKIQRKSGITEYTEVVRRIPMSEKSNVRVWVNRVMRMYEKFQKQNGHPDIILAHSSMWAGLAAARIRKKWGTPYVITEHRGRFTGIGNLPDLLIKPWHLPLYQEAFKNAEHIITVSEALQQKIREIEPGVAGRLSSIPNMTDTEFFNINKKNNNGPFTFLCVAGYEPVKGIDLLIEAFALLRDQTSRPVKLIIAGKDTEVPALQQMIRQHHLQDDVTCSGYLNREQLLEHLQSANAFVLPSRFEAFGIVLIEAMACGLPVIATRSGGPEEIVTNESGILCRPESTQDLSDAMQNMFQRAQQYNPEKIRSACVKRFSKDSVTNEYILLFNKLLQNQTS